MKSTFVVSALRRSLNKHTKGYGHRCTVVGNPGGGGICGFEGDAWGL